MKIFLFILATALLPCTSLAQSNPKLDSLMALIDTDQSGVKKLDAKYGFRDLKFETPIALVKGAVAVGPASHGERKYRRPNESKAVGRYVLSDVVYTFYKGRLAGVRIQTKGNTNSTGLLSMFESLYGIGSQDDRYPDSYAWFGRKVLMNYQRNPSTGDATIDIFSKSLMGAASAALDADDEKAASEL